MASFVWQLMFLHGDKQVYSMSVSEAKKLGYSLTASAQRLVLRAQYKQPQAEIKMVSEDNVMETTYLNGLKEFFTFTIR